MDGLIEFTKGIVMQHGYGGIFWLTAAEQFIFPVPVDFFVGLGTGMGLAFKKMLTLIFIATILGSIVGYFLGKFLGKPIASWLLGKQKLDKGEKFIKKWGILGVIFAGLTPIPFKIVTWTAGIFEMPFWKFLIGVLIGRIPRYFVTAYAGALIYQTKFYATTEMSALILGTLQGITEFLPISSSGHLVIMEQFLKLPIGPKEMAMFDIILHGGSLLAIIVYFWRDWINVLKEIWKMLSKWTFDKNSLAFKLAVGTIPAIFAGLIFGEAIRGPLRNLHSIAILFIFLSLLYFYAAWKGRKNESENVTLKKSVIIGLTQAVALIPGISRSGVTISTGVITGIKKEIAAKFSFMLGAVAILAANVYALFSIERGAIIPNLRFILLGFGTSFIVSFVAIIFLLKYLEKHTMRAFGVYLLLVGILILSFM
jgi:undecaprenyl-diphosphatase